MINKYSAVIFSILCGVVCVLISQFVFCSAYKTNDDALMQMISSGVISGTPSPYLYLSSTLWGRVLVALNNISTLPNWYYLGLLSLYFLFIVSIVYYVYKRLDKGKRRLILPFIIGSCLYLLGKPQFTIIGILFSFTAFLYLKAHILTSSIKYLIIGCFFLMLGVLIRYDIIFVFALFFAIPLLFLSYQHKVKYMPFILLAVLAILFANNHFEKKEMSNMVGFNIDDYVKATENIIDNPAIITRADMKSMGWDSSAVHLLKSYFFTDIHVFSYENTKRFAHYVDAVNTPSKAISIIKSQFKRARIALVALLIFLFIFYSHNLKDKIILYILVSSFTLVLFLAFNVRLPARVFLPILFLNVFIFLIRGDISRYQNLLILAFGLVMCAYLFILIKDTREHKREYVKFDDSLQYLKDHPQNIYQLTSSEITFEYLSGFYNKFHNHPCNFIGYGWLIGTPAYFEHLRRFGLKDHLLDVVRRSDIMLVTKDTELIVSIKDFMCDFYNTRVDFKQIDTIPITVYEIMPSNDPCDPLK